jgi:Transposase and inactivated derivatives
MSKPRKEYDPEFKMKIVLALLRGESSQHELGRRHNVSPTMIAKWKDKFLEVNRHSTSSLAVYRDLR